MLNTAYLGLGSNLGDRHFHLTWALKELESHLNIRIVHVSRFFNTKAVSPTPQPDYLNAAVEIETDLSARELLMETLDIEKRLGRKVKGDRSPREMDIDILLYGDELISDYDLVVPHPLMHERLFVLEPLKDIAPDVEHPVLYESILSIYTTLKAIS
jgi:2-amino-4-hydroxy-6-hydroxymethyldihydropteridine diphosphokinase